MKTAVKQSETRQNLLNAALSLMLDKGYVATSVDEICAEAKVTKGSFFHYFKSKEALAKVLVEDYAKVMQNNMRESSCCESGDPLDRVYAYLDCMGEMSKNPDLKGCLIGTFSQELSETHPEIRELCSKSFEGMAQMFKKDMVAAKAKHAPKASFDAQSLADYFIAVAQGSLILMKAKKDRGVMQKNILHFRNYLKTLFER